MPYSPNEPVVVSLHFIAVIAYCVLWLKMGKYTHRLFANIDNQEQQTMGKICFVFFFYFLVALPQPLPLSCMYSRRPDSLLRSMKVDKMHERKVKCHTFIINYFLFYSSSWQVCVLGIVFRHISCGFFTLMIFMQMKRTTLALFLLHEITVTHLLFPLWCGSMRRDGRHKCISTHDVFAIKNEDDDNDKMLRTFACNTVALHGAWLQQNSSIRVVCHDNINTVELMYAEGRILN